jgi:isocitrate dehydrogenase (NAD+)
MLRHLGEQGRADRLEAAVTDLLQDGRVRIYDLLPLSAASTASGTKAVGEAFVNRLRSGAVV